MEDSVPMPTDSGGAYSEIREKAMAACQTLRHMTLADSFPVAGARKDVREATAEMINSVANESSLPNPYATHPGAMYVKKILQEYDVEVVENGNQLRKFVTNKLIVETENNDPRVRIRALELLGKVSDVGLFTERSEVTVNNRSTVELEDTLKEKLRRLMGKDDIQDVDYVEKSDKA